MALIAVFILTLSWSVMVGLIVAVLYFMYAVSRPVTEHKPVDSSTSTVVNCSSSEDEYGE
jgi:MFS superfamily sulfate permease-like transporter